MVMKCIYKIAWMGIMFMMPICFTKAAEPAKSEEAARLLQVLRGIHGKKILSGTMACVNWNISEAQWVHQHTGKWPAMAGFDFIHLPYSSPGGWIDYDNTGVLEDWHRQGGIISICWHWMVPARSGKSDKFAFYWGNDRGKEDEQTTFDVRKIFDEKSTEYQRMMSDIDRVGQILLKLKGKGIPVLWRPLHEAGGMWFWWGRDPEACNELWRIMYRRFQEMGADNLIWVWTQSSAWGKPYSDGYRWYPGDDYVDIVGMDIYNEASATTIRTKCYDFLKEQSPTKLIALTELGTVAEIGRQWAAGAHWLYFMPWYDYNVTNNIYGSTFSQTSHGNANISWWNEAFGHDEVMTRDGMKELMTSGIYSHTTVPKSSVQKDFFTIDGKRVQFPKHGLYIKNGKKVIITRNE